VFALAAATGLAHKLAGFTELGLRCRKTEVVVRVANSTAGVALSGKYSCEWRGHAPFCRDGTAPPTGMEQNHFFFISEEVIACEALPTLEETLRASFRWS
jgi:hypothetical protein